jgi:hypothetical protein
VGEEPIILPQESLVLHKSFNTLWLQPHLMEGTLRRNRSRGVTPFYSYRLKKKLDENWYEGEVGGKVGIFPVSYVEVVIPLP